MAALTDPEIAALAALKVSADGPLAAARSMAPTMYHSASILEREQEALFASDWVSPGLAAEIPHPGNYITYSIGEQPVFCVRDRDGEIRTMSNVCRHRMMTLVQGRGSAKKIVCPYHAWTYDLNGTLVAANHMAQTDGFERADHCLPQFRTEIWHGWIYVTANPDAPPVAEVLAPLAPLVEPYEIANYVPVVSTDEVWDGNWKLLTENFMEGYHLPVAHKATVGTWMPMTSVAFPERHHGGFTYQIFIKDENAQYGRAHPENRRFFGDARYTTVMPTVFPAHMYILAPDHLWYLSLRPHGPEQVRVRFGIALAPEVNASLDEPEAWIGELSSFFDQVNREDQALVAGLAQGSRAGDAVGGPLSWLEHELHDFHQYLASRLL